MPAKKAPKKPPGRKPRPKRAPKRAAADVERPITAPEVTMSGAEIDRLRDRLRRKFH
jgi:hypothetical protein